MAVIPASSCDVRLARFRRRFGAPRRSQRAGGASRTRDTVKPSGSESGAQESYRRHTHTWQTGAFSPLRPSQSPNDVPTLPRRIMEVENWTLGLLDDHVPVQTFTNRWFSHVFPPSMLHLATPAVAQLSRRHGRTASRSKPIPAPRTSQWPFQDVAQQKRPIDPHHIYDARPSTS